MEPGGLFEGAGISADFLKLIQTVCLLPVSCLLEQTQKPLSVWWPAPRHCGSDAAPPQRSHPLLSRTRGHPLGLVPKPAVTFLPMLHAQPSPAPEPEGIVAERLLARVRRSGLKGVRAAAPGCHPHAWCWEMNRPVPQSTQKGSPRLRHGPRRRKGGRGKR